MKTMILGDVCTKIASGATPTGGRDAYKGGNTTLIRSQNVRNEGFDYEGLVQIDDRQADSLSNVEVQADDVLLNITGDSVARCCLVSSKILPARVNQHVLILRPRRNELDPKYLTYFLVSSEMQDQLLAAASRGGTRNALTKSMIEALPVRAPSLAEQTRIAGILDEADRLRLKHLEAAEVAREMLGAVFNNQVNSFERCGQVELSKISTLNPRMPRSFADQNDRPVSFLPMSNLGEDGSYQPIDGRTLGELKKGYTFFEPGDVLVAKITPCMENGKAAFISDLPHGVGFGSTEFHVVRADPEQLDGKYLFYMLWREHFRNRATESLRGGAGQQRVPTGFLERYQIPIPFPSDPVRSVKAQKRVVSALDEAESMRCHHLQGAKTAADLLASLSQRAFRGQL